MFRKVLLVLFVAVQFVAIANLGTNIIPLPRCFPCDVR